MPDSYIPRDAFSGDKMNPGLALFVQNQQAQKKLALEEQLKNAEISAMMERARMTEAGATERTNINRTSAESIAAANQAMHEKIASDRLEAERSFHKKDTLTIEQIDGINASTPGLNIPRIDGFPVATTATLIGVFKSGQSDISRENRADDRNDRIVAGQAAAAERTLQFHKDVQGNLDRRYRFDMGKAEQAEVEKRRIEERKSFAAEMGGALNTDEHPKTNLPTRFSPTKLLEEDPIAALAISEKAGRLGWPEKVGVKPLGPFRNKGWLEQPSLYDVKKQEFEVNKARFIQNLKAPPTTGHGGPSMTKGLSPGGVPPGLGPLTPPTPAATQQVPTTPSAMGGFEGTVGPQPTQIGPGPTAASSPSSPSMTQPRPTVIRMAPDGRKIEYDAVTKQPLRVVQ